MSSKIKDLIYELATLRDNMFVGYRDGCIRLFIMDNISSLTLESIRDILKRFGVEVEDVEFDIGLGFAIFTICVRGKFLDD